MTRGRPLRISLFMPRRNAWYATLLRQMVRGFREAGFVADGDCGLLGEEALRRWCAVRRPDVVFEMNRCGADVPFLDPRILHLAWIVDFNGRPLGDFHGSAITYLFGQRWLASYPHRSACFKWLGPGACPHDYARARHSHFCDASFVGHIPRPWSPAELDRTVAGGLSFGDLLPALRERIRAERARLVAHEDYLAVADGLCRSLAGAALQADPVLGYDISGRLIRLLNRQELIDRILGLTDYLHLYGPPNWGEWPAYGRHYRAFLNGPRAMRRVYQGSRINFHEGNGIHFRSMDCMTAGGLLFYKSRDVDGDPGGIRTLFEPGVHYVPFDDEGLPELFRYYLRDRPAAEAVRDNAARVMREGHTWRHRAMEIRADLRRFHGL